MLPEVSRFAETVTIEGDTTPQALDQKRTSDSMLATSRQVAPWSEETATVRKVRQRRQPPLVSAAKCSMPTLTLVRGCECRPRMRNFSEKDKQVSESVTRAALI